MIAGGNWWRANEIVIRHLTRQTVTRYRCRDRAPCPSSGGVTDQVDCAAVAHQLEDGRAPQNRCHSKDASAQYLPPYANGVHCEKSQQQRARPEIERAAVR